jgi:hypothetical protein
MPTNEHSGFSLRKGVGLRPVPLPKAPTGIVTQLIDPALVPPEYESEGQGSHPANTTVHTPVNTPETAQPQPVAVSGGTRLPVRPGERRKRKPTSITVTFRFPLDMSERLRRTADYNNVTQTAILLEALDLHLPSFPQPPDGWEAK